MHVLYVRQVSIEGGPEHEVELHECEHDGFAYLSRRVLVATEEARQHQRQDLLQGRSGEARGNARDELNGRKKGRLFRIPASRKQPSQAKGRMSPRR